MQIRLIRESHTPLYVQIADQLKAKIAEGVLQQGDRLPASRDLASSLGVHRVTVGNAYAELEAEKIIRSHVGRGTFVARVPFPGAMRQGTSLPAPLRWEALFVNEPVDERLHDLIEKQNSRGAISFAYALPPVELFPYDDIKRSVNRVLRQEGHVLLQIGESRGYAPMLDALAARMAKSGINVGTNEIIVTNGCQQSLDLVRRLFVAPGEVVVAENPTYPGALSVFSRQEMRCLSAPVTDSGIDLNLLEDILALHRVKLIYTAPTFHNPTGVTMNLETRQRLLDLAFRYRVPIVEDDIYADLRYRGTELPSLKAMDKHGVVIYLNSFSKIGFPGLRVGWIVAPAPVIERLVPAKQTCDLHTNLLSQAALCDFSRLGLLAKHIKRVKRVFADRLDCMLEALHVHLSGIATWNSPQGGMCIWVNLPDQLNAVEVLSSAIKRGIVFSPGEIFYVTAPQRQTLRLTFTMADEKNIERGIRTIGSIIRSQLRLRGSPDESRETAKTVLV